MESTNDLLERAKQGFQTLKVGDRYKESALKFIKQWLEDPMFASYVPQIQHMILKEYWDYLLDSFYKIIPFGTGGRRGEVGIGPNRINMWTIQASAQGHSQYLMKKYGDEAKERGIVFTYDVREFFTNQYFNAELPNPVTNLKCKDLAIAAAEVYAANGIKVYMFDDVRTTPELSFAIRHLHAIAGDMFSASHNPPSHNGKKVYDEFGGQLVPPFDEELVDEVTKNVSAIKTLSYEKAKEQGLVQMMPATVDDAYIKAAGSVSLSKKRDIKIAYTPLHGVGKTSVPRVLRHLGFEVFEDPKTSNYSGRFENVTFNIPNPEVIESFATPLQYAKEINADILLNSDPDADRIGIMVRHKGDWTFFSGNEIAAVIAEYAVQKRKQNNVKQGIIITTIVTNSILRQIALKNNYIIIDNLLVGFKYIGEEMNKLDAAGTINDFIVGCEESHGYISGNYARDKDAVTAAVWLSELAAELKDQNKTLVDYLDEVCAKYGYFKNYLTEIRMLGAVGIEKIQKIQKELRTNPPKSFGNFVVQSFEDCLNRLPILSETDRSSKDVLVFNIAPTEGTISIKVTVRPSGTEPKIKMYFEIGSNPTDKGNIQDVKERVERIMQELEKAVMKACYGSIGVDFPDRGFLLFWQLPLDDKIKYFEIEPEIEKLKNESDASVRKQKLQDLTAFLGSDPLQKVNKAFEEKYNVSIEDYLKI